MRNWKLIALLASLPLLASKCETHDPFDVRVIDDAGNPIDSARIQSIDWTYDNVGWSCSSPATPTIYYDVETAATGWARLPRGAYQRKGLIYQFNFHPRLVTLSPDAVFNLTPMPARCKILGTFDARSSFFTGNALVTIVYNGTMTCYALNDSIVSPPVSQTTVIDGYLLNSLLVNDTLWINNTHTQLREIDLTDPSHPSLIREYSLYTGGKVEAVSGDILIATRDYEDYISIFQITPGGLSGRAEITVDLPVQVRLVGRNLLVLDDEGWRTFDLTTPGQPKLLEYRSNPGMGKNSLFCDSLMFVPEGWDASPGGYYYYNVKDPVNFEYLGLIQASGAIVAISDPYHAVISVNTAFPDLPNGVHDGYFWAIRQENGHEFETKGFAKGRSIITARGKYVVCPYDYGVQQLQFWQ